jgi:GNAT superfamily N-acetyltransferase
MISFEWEKGYDRFYAEAEPLIRAHWNEVGTHRDILQLNPRHDAYRFLEKSGNLEMLVARCDGAIIGYFFLIFTQHPRDISKILAQDDIVYAKPEYRRQLLGFTLTKIALARAETRGFIVAFRAKDGRCSFLKRLGFSPRDVIWTKVSGVEANDARI